MRSRWIRQVLLDNLESEIGRFQACRANDIAIRPCQIRITELAGCKVDTGIQLDALITPGNLLLRGFPESELAEHAHEVERFGLGQEFQWPDQAMFRVMPADERLGLSGQPLLPGVTFDLGLISKDDFAFFDRILQLLARDFEQAAPAAARRSAELVEIEIPADPLGVVVAGQLVDKLRLRTGAQRRTIPGYDDAERCAILCVFEGTDSFHGHVGLRH
jgi:hypothetical protein